MEECSPFSNCQDAIWLHIYCNADILMPWDFTIWTIDYKSCLVIQWTLKFRKINTFHAYLHAIFGFEIIIFAITYTLARYSLSRFQYCGQYGNNCENILSGILSACFFQVLESLSAYFALLHFTGLQWNFPLYLFNFQ